MITPKTITEFVGIFIGVFSAIIIFDAIQSMIETKEEPLKKEIFIKVECTGQEKKPAVLDLDELTIYAPFKSRF